MGWTTHAVMPGSKLTNMDYLDGLPLSVGLYTAGMPGLVLTKLCVQMQGGGGGDPPTFLKTGWQNRLIFLKYNFLVK